MNRRVHAAIFASVFLTALLVATLFSGVYVFLYEWLRSLGLLPWQIATGQGVIAALMATASVMLSDRKGS